MYAQDLTRTSHAVVGQQGISEPVFNRALSRAEQAMQELANAPLPVLSRCQDMSDLPAIEALAADIRKKFKTVFVCGMGGSSLSGKMLTALAENPFTQRCGDISIRYLENIDPYSLTQLTSTLDAASTCFIMVSKSGGTAETMSQAGILWQAMEAVLGAKTAEHFFAITEARSSVLRRFTERHNIKCLEHPADVGGRYAALTLVGLLPAAIAGLNIRKIRQSASAVIADAYAKPGQAEPVKGAVVSFLMSEQGKNISVHFPYCDRLQMFTLWHRQIWAESLGKKGKGITPVPAIGSVDQHSQMQLYLDGPRDKFFTLYLLKQEGKGSKIPALQDEALTYLEHHPVGDVIEAQQLATLETLVRNQCPSRVINLQELNEESLGALTMHFMLETLLTANLMGIDPLDQPAVEDGKKLTIARLTQGKH